jgi:hypothetical protein
MYRLFPTLFFVVQLGKILCSGYGNKKNVWCIRTNLNLHRGLMFKLSFEKPGKRGGSLVLQRTKIKTKIKDH